MIGPNFRDPTHSFLACDVCLSLGIRLEAIPAQVYRDGEWCDEMIGKDLTVGEARQTAADHGWLVAIEQRQGDRLFIRDYCPPCRLTVVA